MEKFESHSTPTPEAANNDVSRLRSHLESLQFAHFDDCDAVLEIATEYFSNHPAADVQAIVSELYKQEQEAALRADETAGAL